MKNITISPKIFIFILLLLTFLFPLIIQLSNIYRGLFYFYLLFPISIPYFLFNWLFVSVFPSFYYETESISVSHHFIGWLGFLCFSLAWLIIFSLLFYIKKSTREMMKMSLLIALPLYIIGFVYLGYVTTNIPFFSPGFNSSERIDVANSSFDSLNLKIGLDIIPEDAQASEKARRNGELPYFSYPCTQNGKNYTCSSKIFYFTPYIVRPEPSTDSYVVYLNGESLFKFPIKETNTNYLSMFKVDNKLLVYYGNQALLSSSSKDKGYEKYVLYDTISKQAKFIKFNLPGPFLGENPPSKGKIAINGSNLYLFVNGLDTAFNTGKSTIMTYNFEKETLTEFASSVNDKCKISYIGVRDGFLYWSENFQNKRWSSESYSWNPSCFTYKKQLF